MIELGSNVGHDDSIQWVSQVMWYCCVDDPKELVVLGNLVVQDTLSVINDLDKSVLISSERVVGFLDL